jgi:hypothetical protein
MTKIFALGRELQICHRTRNYIQELLRNDDAAAKIVPVLCNRVI